MSFDLKSPLAMTHDVYISYASADAAIARAIVQAVEAREIRCWIAPRDVERGKAWVTSILNGIRAAKVMVVVHSAKADDSRQLVREVEQGVNDDLAIIVVRTQQLLPSERLQYFLSARDWIDAFPGYEDSWLDNLIARIVLRLGSMPI